MIEVFFVSLLSFVLTYTTTPYFIKYFKKKGLVGIDIHKEKKHEVPENCGISIFLSYLLSLLILFLLLNEKRIILVLLLVFIIGLLGILDRYRRFSPKEKMIYFTLVGAPLAFFGEGSEALALPILFMAATNFTNMLAGFNGLEIGLGFISAISLALIGFFENDLFILAVSLPLALSALAFLRYNFYPAKAFPGDVGTLIFGAAIFSAIALTKKYFALLLFAPHFLDAFLKFISAGILVKEKYAPTEIKDGKLIYAGGYLSLPRFILKIKPMHEKNLVITIWLIEIFFSMLVVIYYAYH